MLGIWLLEIAKGIGKLFLNPLFYWVILLLFMMSWRRIIRERRQFGKKIYPIFTECKGTLFISITFSIIISLLAILIGLVMSLEMMLIMIVVIILISLTGRTTFLSGSYTLGLTFLLMTLLPYFELGSLGKYVNFEQVTIIQLLTLTFVMALLLLAEALLINSKKGASFPEMTLGARGKWIGQHRLKRVAFIPFFTLLPVGQANLTLPLFPYFEYGGEGYQLVFVPFIIGVNYIVRSELPKEAGKRLGQRTWLLSAVVLSITLTALYYPYLSIVAFLVAIIGKEWIIYKHKKRDKYSRAVFTPLNQGIKVLALLPGTPGDRLGIHIGETILKVNGQAIHTENSFYEALQNSGAYFKLDVIDKNGEVRFINSAFYEEDHYELGIVFVEESTAYNRAQ